MKKILLIIFLLLIPKISFATIGDLKTTPAISCLHIKQANSSAKDGKYWIKTDKMSEAKEFYCDMTTAGGGWMLIFQRRVGMPGIFWENYKNTETCGENLNDFLHNLCGDLDNLSKNKESYSSNVTETLNKNYFGEYLFLNYDYRGTLDRDDAYRIKTNKNIFPNDLGLSNIPVKEICDINNSNCDSTNVYWLYAGTSRFNGASCNGGYNGSTSLKGNYGYCHNGILSNYLANSLYGNRNGYNETKLWDYNTGDSKNYLEKVFIRYKDPEPTDITLSNNTFNSTNSLPINIGTFSTIDETTNDTHIYSFVSGKNDNSYFSISGENLILNNSSKDIYNIQIKTTDSFGQSYEKYFYITKKGTIKPGIINNPIISCQQLKNEYPDFPSGIYYLQNENMDNPKKVYCDMTTAGGGWMLLFKRAGGTQNEESCGTNLNDFLQNDCGNVANLEYSDSYSIDMDKTMEEIGGDKYLVIQKDSSDEISSDSYMINSKNKLFPNTIGDLKNISYEKICNINGENCDDTNGYWLYAGTSRYNSSYCDGGYAGSTSYKGNYGYCHNGINSHYLSNSLFGSRKGYEETKLWGYYNAVEYSEFVFIKNSSEITSFFPKENNIIPGKNTKIDIKYSDENIDTSSAKLRLYKSGNSGNFGTNNILANHTNSSNISLTNTGIIVNLENLDYGKYKYYFEIKNNKGDKLSVEKVFYMDSPELILDKDILDLGTLEKNNKKFSDTLNIKVKTIGAGFKIYLKNEKNPSSGIYILENWDNSKGYGYNSDNSSNINTFTASGVSIAEQDENINTSGELNTYNYTVKLGELLKNNLPAGKYEGNIGFKIFFNY